MSLRAIREGETPGIESWYGEAAGAAFENRALEELRRSADHEKGELLTIAQADADESIGLLEYRVGEAEGGWLTVPFIALAKANRGWGYGSEAVRLLEEWAVREWLAERFRTEVDVRNGLGLYFWLRLGYRPLAIAEAKGRDVLAMVRDRI